MNKGLINHTAALNVNAVTVHRLFGIDLIGRPDLANQKETRRSFRRSVSCFPRWFDPDLGYDLYLRAHPLLLLQLRVRLAPRIF